MKRAPRPIRISRVIRQIALTFAVAAAIGCLWLATAGEPDAAPEFTPEQIDTAKKHADFKTLASAKTIVVGKIRVTIEGVAESFPPIYEMRMVVTPTEVIAGDVAPDKPFTVRFSRHQEEEPKFKDVPYLIAVGNEDHPMHLLLLKPIEGDMSGIAKIATAYGTAQRAKNAALARENPEMHPLFETLQKAKHIAVIQSSSDPDGAVAFDLDKRLEERYSITVVTSLRGDLKPGVLKRLWFTEEAARGSHREMLIAIVEFRDGQPVVTLTLRADEEELRVAAAASKVDPAAFLKQVQTAKDEFDGHRRAARSRQLFRGVIDGIFGGSQGSSEPSEGSTTPSFDGTPSGEDFERDE